MNIESANINRSNGTQSQTTKTARQNSSVKFADELDELKKTSANESNDESEVKEPSENKEPPKEKASEEEIDKSLEELNSVVKELSQSDEKEGDKLKEKEHFVDNSKKGEILINNDVNIQENKDLLPQMNPNMNFSGDGQPFSSFMNNNENSGDKLGYSEKDLAEEAAILSTMAENLALVNKNNIEQNVEKTVTKEDGIKKVDTRTNIVTETVVKFDTIAMNEADVEVFTNLVGNKEINLNNLAPQAAEKSVQVSKTLADMLAKSMETNQPVRINFDNDISVIIRISKDGKISADFLPSSQVAEAYLKENLPLLKQRFDDNNLDYNELNQRERREQNKDDNKKKGRNNE